MPSIITTTLYLLAALVPLIFTTVNSELFEFPKFILLLSGTLIIGTAWLIDIMVNQSSLKTFTRRWPMLHYAVISILATQTLATVFSINPYTSFWGYYSRFHQGLLTTICYTIIYFAASNYLNKENIQKLIKISVYTSFLISLYAILEHFGIDKKIWIQDVVNRPFSTLGQPNWLAAYLLPNLFLALYMLRKNTKFNYTTGFLFLTLLSALFLTKSRSGLAAFGLSYLIYWLLITRQFTFNKIKKSLLTNVSIVALCILLTGTSYTPSIHSLFTPKAPATDQPSIGTVLENGGTESGDIRKIVWSGALQLIQKHPLLGTGPETFAYTYYWVRPEAHNYTSEWDFLYNKAHNEYLNIAATCGLLGLSAYLYFHWAMFYLSLRRIPHSKKVDQSKDEQLRELSPVLGATIVSFFVTNFFGFSVIPVYLITTLIGAVVIAGYSSDADITVKPASNSAYYALIPFLTLLYPATLFVADYHYARGKALLDANQASSAIPLLISASSARPMLDLYHSALGEAYAQVGKKEEALHEAAITRTLNPYHLNFHKSRAKIYLTLAADDPSFYQNARDELTDATRLAPTDPKLAYNLGLIYTRLGDNDSAISQFKRSLALKNDYESPYYALALLYEQSGHKDLIPDLLRDATTHLATYSAALKDKIDNYQLK